MTKRYCKCEETHREVHDVKLKRCPKCMRWKEEGEFGPDRARKDGLKIYCKGCINAYVRECRRKNQKVVRDYLRYEDRHRVIRGFKEKQCSRCKQWKYYSGFSKSSGSKDGLSCWCKECKSKRTEYKRKGSRMNLRFEDRHRVVNGIKEKFCRKCGKWKKENEFYINRSAKDGLDDRCQKCSYTATRKSHELKGKSMRRYLRYEERHRVINGTKQKYCRKCKRWKNESEFYKDRSKKDCLNNQCKKCSYNVAHKKAPASTTKRD